MDREFLERQIQLAQMEQRGIERLMKELGIAMPKVAMFPEAKATQCDHGVSLLLNCGHCAWLEESAFVEEVQA
jgi:hypothetical protein